MNRNIDSLDIDAGPRLADRGGVLARIQPLSPWLVIAALFAVAMASRHVVAANTDVSWLLIAGERMLDGQRLYADILETNPPMSVLVYIPAILIGRALGLPAENVVDGLLFVAVAISLTIVSALLMNSSSVLGRV
jgi:hypothetical protein